MEEVKVETGFVSYSKHFELTFVSGTQKTHLGDFCNVRRINCELMGVILAELEHDPDTLRSIEQRLQHAVWYWAGGNPSYGLLRISITLDEGYCSLLPHGVWKGVNITSNDIYSTALRFCVRKKVQLKSLLELTSIVVAGCLLVELGCNLLEVPRDLLADIRRGFQSRWIHRSHRVNMHGGSCQLCKEHVGCASCICFFK